jgi:signal transduction histidine kinase
LQLEKLREKDKQLQYQSRLIQMGKMLSMIAHQWRQPLAAIAATTSFLSAKLMLEEVNKQEFEEEIGRIETYVSHLSKTIDDFRSFFKAVKQQERVSLDVVVEKTLNIVKPLLVTKNITVITDFTCKQEIETYSNELAQVILNIIKNAEDALLDNAVCEPTIWIRTYDDACMLYLEIKDNAGDAGWAGRRIARQRRASLHCAARPAGAGRGQRAATAGVCLWRVLADGVRGGQLADRPPAAADGGGFSGPGAGVQPGMARGVLPAVEF